MKTLTGNGGKNARQASEEPPILSIEELDADPHGNFRKFRTKTSLIRRTDGSYIALRAVDVQNLINDPRTRQLETEFIKTRGINEGPMFTVIGSSMLFSNGSDHRRRRAPMSRTFAFRMITALRPHLRAIAEGIINAHLKAGQMNLLDHYAALIPARAISSILGLPEQDILQFTDWVYTFSRVLNLSFSPEDVPAINDAAQHLMDYAERLLTDRRWSPRDDFLTSFARVVDDDGELSAAETLAQIVILIVGGSDTTRAAMAMQVALLLQHRGQWDAVCHDATLIPGAVLEALRYEPVAASVSRFTLQDVEVGGHVVPANRLLTLSTLSAMRDPALYADPDCFDIRRTDHPRWHLIFGGGAHRCLGEALAKAELEEGLAVLATRLPDLQFAGEFPRMEGHSGLRRINAMHVAWTRR